MNLVQSMDLAYHTIPIRRRLMRYCPREHRRKDFALMSYTSVKGGFGYTRQNQSINQSRSLGHESDAEPEDLQIRHIYRVTLIPIDGESIDSYKDKRDEYIYILRGSRRRLKY